MSCTIAQMAAESTPAELIETLELVGKERALSQTESLLLERSILLQDGKRIPRGLTKALTRRGIKRDMRRFHK
jgi:hypothetical protein